MGLSSHLYPEVTSLDDNELLKIANIAKIAWTARDVHHAVWRAAGGFAKESTPWSKGFTPGLTQKLEGNVISKLQGNPALQDKYTKLLANRATKTYTGNNISRGLGGAPYAGLGKSRKEVDPERALAGIKRGVGGKIRAARKVTPVEASAGYRGAGVTSTRDARHGSIIKQEIQLQKPLSMSLYDRLNAAITNTHEGSELYRMKNPTSKHVGIGTHRSYSVLADEQKALRDVPDSVYLHRYGMRTEGDYPDKKKLDILAKNHGVSIRHYGASLRNNQKEIKAVDSAADDQQELSLQAKKRYDAIYYRASNTPMSHERYNKIVGALNKRMEGTYTSPTWG